MLHMILVADMRVLMALMVVICTNLHAEPTNGVRLPSITHAWADEGSSNLAPITIDEIRQCMGSESNVAKEYASFNEASSLLKAEGMELESLNKSLESEHVGLEEAFKQANGKIAQLNDNSAKLDLMKAELNALAKQKLDAKQAKEANERVAKYNQMASAQNESAKNAHLETTTLYAKQAAFNEKVALAKSRFDQYNHKAALFDERRFEFNNKLTAVQDKCTGTKRLVK